MLSTLLLTLSAFLFLPAHAADPQQAIQALLNGDIGQIAIPPNLSEIQVETQFPESKITKKNGQKRFILDELVERYVACKKKDPEENQPTELMARRAHLNQLSGGFNTKCYFNPTSEQISLSVNYYLASETRPTTIHMLINLLKSNSLNTVFEKIKNMPPCLFSRAEEKDKYKILCPFPIEIDNTSILNDVNGITFKTKASAGGFGLLQLVLFYPNANSVTGGTWETHSHDALVSRQLNLDTDRNNYIIMGKLPLKETALTVFTQPKIGTNIKG